MAQWVLTASALRLRGGRSLAAYLNDAGAGICCLRCLVWAVAGGRTGSLRAGNVQRKGPQPLAAGACGAAPGGARCPSGHSRGGAVGGRACRAWALSVLSAAPRLGRDLVCPRSAFRTPAGAAERCRVACVGVRAPAPQSLPSGARARLQV